MTHTEPLRTCRDCNLTANTEEELNLFVICKRHTHNRRNLCYKCENKRENIWRSKNGESILRKRRKHYAEKVYCTTYEEYKKRMSTSDKCEICSSKDSLCYDHDHKTMKFRGVLCNKCNRSIGQLGDTKESIKKVLNYLER
jgi:hypothetical protein